MASSTSLQYPNFLSENVVSNLTLSGYVGITKPVEVINGVTLTIVSNSEVHLDYKGDLTIAAGATLIIEDNVSIFSNSNYGMRQLIVNGNLYLGNDVLFTTSPPLPLQNRIKISH